MALSAASLVRLLGGELKNLPKDIVVGKLIESGTVESLTELKFILVGEASDKVDGFPKSELYIRRRPREGSSFNTLEERLAHDVSELNICIDSGIVTPEIKAMFKVNESCSGEVCNSLSPLAIIHSERYNNDSLNEILACNSNSSESTEMNKNNLLAERSVREHLAKIESSFMLFREHVSEEMSKLKNQLDKQAKILDLQDKQIDDLLEVNSLQKSELKTIKQELSKHVQCDLYNLTNSSRPQEKKSMSDGTDNNFRLIRQATYKSCANRNVTSYNKKAQANSKSIQCLSKQGSLKNGNALENSSGKGSIVDRVKEAAPVSLTARSSPALENNEPAIDVDALSVAPVSNSPNATEPDTGSTLQSVQPTEDGFTGVERKRSKVKKYLLSGIDERVNDVQIFSFLEKRGINPTHLKVFPSRRRGTKSAKLNILQSDCPKIATPNFWPRFVTCKPWLTKGQLDKVNEERRCSDAQRHLKPLNSNVDD